MPNVRLHQYPCALLIWSHSSTEYPLVPSLADWLFPHGYLTSIWPQFSVIDMPPSRALPPEGGLIDVLLAHDITCRLTDTVEGTEHAHLVLCSEVARFQRNTMFRYDASPRPEVEPINVPRNALSLRSDIHIVFDQCRFATVSKPLSSGETGRENFSLAVHVFSPGSSTQFAKFYHHIAIQPLHGISLEYIFAGFAWTVFAYSAQFPQQGVKDRCALYRTAS